MSHDLAGMQSDISGLIDDWGKRTIVSRLSATLTASKRLSGTFVNKLSGIVWIQPIPMKGTLMGAGPTTVRRSLQGLLDETTHIAISRKTLAIQANDKLLPSGETYLYDVLDNEENPTHNTIQLRRVKHT